MGALGELFWQTRLLVATIGVIFGAVLLYSAYHSLNPKPELSGPDHTPDRLAALRRLDGTYPTEHGPLSYQLRAVQLGFGLMGVGACRPDQLAYLKIQNSRPVQIDFSSK